MNINEIRINPNNPRFIKDDRYQKLKNSIKYFPKMMKLRPIIIDDNGKCFMMEISELYCDVIINRFEQFTNKKAVKIT